MVAQQNGTASPRQEQHSAKSVDIELPPKLIPVFAGEATYRGAYGGRGSGKTRSFAKMAAVRGLMFAKAGVSGIILCGREFMNSLDESSMAEVKAAIASEPWLSDNYDVGEKYIRTLDGRVHFKFAGLRHNIESIKSKAKILILWVDEAEPVTEEAWQTAIPSVREDKSEIWVTWNPRRRTSATNKRFRLDAPRDSRIVELGWRDNPWFPKILEKQRAEDFEKRPDSYPHVWEGDYATIIEGAYYAKALLAAKTEGRICRVSKDPLLTVRSYHDIGGSGAQADAYTIWIAQFVGQEIRILDYYESVGQTLDYHVSWMRERGWEKARVYLPHDGTNENNVTGKKYRDHWEDAGFDVTVIQNQGKGAAAQRVEAARRLFPQMWFNTDTTEAGREALAWYHEKKDEKREIGLGPDHDWSSHAADSFGLMAVCHEPPGNSIAAAELVKKLNAGSGRASSYMGM